MRGNFLIVILANLGVAAGLATGQEKIGSDVRQEPPGLLSRLTAPPEKAAGGLLQAFDIGEMAKAADNLKQAADSLQQFGNSMQVIAPIVSDAMTTTSDNMARMTAEFDPFGFKTSFLTIQRQNEIIQQQNELIQELLRKEIERLNAAERPMPRRKKGARRKRMPSKAESDVSFRDSMPADERSEDAVQLRP